MSAYDLRGSTDDLAEEAGTEGAKALFEAACGGVKSIGSSVSGTGTTANMTEFQVWSEVDGKWEIASDR